jgi:hypothetical protein
VGIVNYFVSLGLEATPNCPGNNALYRHTYKTPYTNNIYRYDTSEAKFVLHQTLPGVSKALHKFEMEGKHYLSVPHHYGFDYEQPDVYYWYSTCYGAQGCCRNAAKYQYEVNSYVFEWNPSATNGENEPLGKWESYLSVPTFGADHMSTLTTEDGSKHYLAVANHMGKRDDRAVTWYVTISGQNLAINSGAVITQGTTNLEHRTREISDGAVTGIIAKSMSGPNVMIMIWSAADVVFTTDSSLFIDSSQSKWPIEVAATDIKLVEKGPGYRSGNGVSEIFQHVCTTSSSSTPGCSYVSVKTIDTFSAVDVEGMTFGGRSFFAFASSASGGVKIYELESTQWVLVQSVYKVSY